MCWCDPQKRTPWCDNCYTVRSDLVDMSLKFTAAAYCSHLLEDLFLQAICTTIREEGAEMSNRDDLIKAARAYAAPQREFLVNQIYALMADFHLAQSSEITAERDRMRELLIVANDEFNHPLIQTTFNGPLDIQYKIRAYLKGKGDGEKYAER